MSRVSFKDAGPWVNQGISSHPRDGDSLDHLVSTSYVVKVSEKLTCIEISISEERDDMRIFVACLPMKDQLTAIWDLIRSNRPRRLLSTGITLVSTIGRCSYET